MIGLWRRNVPRHRVAVCSRQMRSRSEMRVTRAELDAIGVSLAVMSGEQLCVRKSFEEGLGR
jgi:hypothetical protein